MYMSDVVSKSDIWKHVNEINTTTYDGLWVQSMRLGLFTENGHYPYIIWSTLLLSLYTEG